MITILVLMYGVTGFIISLINLITEIIVAIISIVETRINNRKRRIEYQRHPINSLLRMSDIPSQNKVLLRPNYDIGKYYNDLLLIPQGMIQKKETIWLFNITFSSAETLYNNSVVIADTFTSSGEKKETIILN